MFIQIVAPSPTGTFTWKPVNEAGVESESRFELRIVPDADQERIRKAHTGKDKFVRGRKRPGRLDFTGYTNAILDYAIVGWTDVHAVTLDGDGKVAKRVPLDCTPEHKVALPEWVKAKVVALCVGKEAGMEADEAEGSEGNDEAPAAA